MDMNENTIRGIISTELEPIKNDLALIKERLAFSNGSGQSQERRCDSHAESIGTNATDIKANATTILANAKWTCLAIVGAYAFMVMIVALRVFSVI